MSFLPWAPPLHSVKSIWEGAQPSLAMNLGIVLSLRAGPEVQGISLSDH